MLLKKTIQQLHLICLCVLIVTIAKAQEPTAVVDSSLLDRVAALEQDASYIKPEDSHLMIVGLLTFGYATNKTSVSFNGASEVSKTNSLGDADHFEFSPMLLWRHGKKFLLEFEPSFSADGLGVNWAAVSYYATPGVILRAGYLVLPFGAYSKKLAAGWINKLGSDPEGIPETTDFAVEAEGGLQAGTMKWSYDFAVSNGMQLQPDGTTQFIGITDNNKNKTFTGRIGWLPFANSSLEIGASMMTGKVGDEGSKFQNANGERIYKNYATVKLGGKAKPFEFFQGVTAIILVNNSGQTLFTLYDNIPTTDLVRRQNIDDQNGKELISIYKKSDEPATGIKILIQYLDADGHVFPSQDYQTYSSGTESYFDYAVNRVNTAEGAMIEFPITP